MPTVSEYGTTEKEAVSKAKTALETQLAKGKLITIELPQTAASHRIEVDSTTKPNNSKFSMQHAGVFADDPSFDDWVEKLTLIRAEANAEVDE